MGVRRWFLRVVRAALLPMALPAVAAASASAFVSSDAAAQTQDRRPWLGIAMEPDPSAPGVRVAHVFRGSPADKAGFREGDRIVRVAELAVARGAEVVHAVGSHGVGDSLPITFVRDGAVQTAQVLLAPFPSQDDVLRMDLIGASAPAWRDLDIVSGSSPTSVSSLRGRVVLLDFWATWCAPCRVLVPKLGDLQARYGAQGLSVVGVSTEDSHEVALFAQRMAMRYAVAVDRRAETTRSYGVVSMPTLIIIDKRGVVRDVAIGYDPSGDARLDATVRGLLAEAPN
jgi:thiol-disulfide isomerase/thioredoxin